MRKGTFIVLLITTCLILSVFTQNVVAIPTTDPLTPNFITTPTTIEGNAELDQLVSSNNFTGTGSINDPYILYFDIIASNEFGHLSIVNTDKYFEIRDSNFENADSYPIYFEQVENGAIINSTITGNGQGIYIYTSDNLLIDDNLITSNSGHGLYLHRSNQNNINNNIISENEFWGIRSQESLNNHYDNNTITYNGGGSSEFQLNSAGLDSHLYGGVAANPSHSNTFTNNNISLNGGDGFYGHEISDLNLTGNYFLLNEEHGIEFEGIEDSFIIGNIFEGNQGIAILLRNSDNIILRDNIMNNGIIVNSVRTSTDTVTQPITIVTEVADDGGLSHSYFILTFMVFLVSIKFKQRKYSKFDL